MFLFALYRRNVDGVSLKGMQRSLCNIRAKALPSSPKSANEILKINENDFVRQNYGLTLRDNEAEKTMFFKHAFQYDEYAFCLFASQDIVNAIKDTIDVKNRQYFMDGTFKVSF